MDASAGSLNKQTKSVDRWFVAIAVSLVLLFLAIQSGVYASAYHAQYRAHSSIEFWNRSAEVPSEAQWQEVELTLRDAIGDAPDNASMINTLGRLYEYRAFQMEKNTVARNLYALKAIIQFRKASLASPAWVYPWLNLAHSKARVRQLDAEFTKAYFNATRLGPWEWNTMAPLVELGLHAYETMPEPERKMVDAYIDRIVEGQGATVAGKLQARGTRDEVCNQLNKRQRENAFAKLCG